MSDTGNASRMTLMAGLLLLLPAWIGLIPSGVPTILCPFPTLTSLPALFMSEYAAVFVPMFFFFAWHPGLFRGEARVPRRSYVFLAILIILSAIDFIADWKFGLEYQGARHTYVLCAVNIIWAGALLIAFGYARKKGSSFGISLWLHWLLFAWLAWYAFPWLGELL